MTLNRIPRVTYAVRDGDAFDPRHAFTRMDTTYLARDLCNAFVWAESADGHEYWADVHARLRAIAATAPVGAGLPMDEPEPRRHEAAGGIREAIGFWGGVDADSSSAI